MDTNRSRIILDRTSLGRDPLKAERVHPTAV
jgi:hypothetical protein